MITNGMIIQAFADRIAGHDVNGALIPRIEDSSPWGACWQALDRSEPGKEYQALFNALRDDQDRDNLIGAIFEAIPGGAKDINAEELSQTLEPVTWLWPQWIPQGLLSMLGGLGGAGKSFVMLDLARRIIHGEPFPDGQPVPTPGAPVIYVDAENIPQIHIERARAWNMNLRRLYFMFPEEPNYMLNFETPEDQDRLVEMIARIKPALVVVDSFNSVHPKATQNVEDVRNVLGFFTAVAKEFSAGFLINHHVVKQHVNGTKPVFLPLNQNSLAGSGHIVNACRCVWGLWGIQTGPTASMETFPRRMEMVKTNFKSPSPLGFDMLPLYDSDSVMLEWGEPAESWREPTKKDECADWLEDLLRNADEPMRPKEIIDTGEEYGFNRRIIYRARKNLGTHVQDTEDAKNSPVNCWKWVD